MLDARPTDALIRVDLQNDFCLGGALEVRGADAIFVQRCNLLAERFRAAGATVVDTQDFHPAGHSSFASVHAGRAPFDRVEMAYGPQTLWPDHCVQGTAGAAFHPALNSLLPHAVVRKGMNRAVDSYSGFRENDGETMTGLQGYLSGRGVRRVYTCGLALDYCVVWTALDALTMGGFGSTLLAGYSLAIDPDTRPIEHTYFLERGGVVDATHNLH